MPLTLRLLLALFESLLPGLIPVVQSLSDEFYFFVAEYLFLFK
tara:strand:+ start:439 stop:567 length:129 start_codon:yes stop_codon:yes gene_type:complete